MTLAITELFLAAWATACLAPWAFRLQDRWHHRHG